MIFKNFVKSRETYCDNRSKAQKREFPKLDDWQLYDANAVSDSHGTYYKKAQSGLLNLSNSAATMPHIFCLS